MMAILTPNEGTKFIVIAAGLLSARYGEVVVFYLFFFSSSFQHFHRWLGHESAF
jgi:hypothetical protein